MPAGMPKAPRSTLTPPEQDLRWQVPGAPRHHQGAKEKMPIMHLQRQKLHRRRPGRTSITDATPPEAWVADWQSSDTVGEGELARACRNSIIEGRAGGRRGYLPVGTGMASSVNSGANKQCS